MKERKFKASPEIEALAAETLRCNKLLERLSADLNLWLSKRCKPGDEQTLIYVLEGAAQRVRSKYEENRKQDRTVNGVDSRPT